jgi:hypothetical protein
MASLMNKEQALQILDSIGWLDRNDDGTPCVSHSKGFSPWINVDSNLTKLQLQALLFFMPDE